MLNLSIDLETFSSVPIAKAGAYKYVQSPDFEILLMAYSVDGNDPEIIDLAQDEIIPQWLYEAIRSPEYIKHAYNAGFEWYCLSKFYGTLLPVNQWRDTMLHGLYCGFTAGLDATGKALGLAPEKQKLTVGKSLIRYFCIPCTPTITNGQPRRNLPKHDSAKWELFKTYCKGDVITEMEIDRRLSAFPVPDEIEKQWQTDMIINARGVAVDMDLVHGALQIGNSTRENLMREAIKITGLENPNSIAQLSRWLETEMNETVTDLRKETVSALLEGQLVTGDAERMLEIRQELGKTSTKKYDAIEASICADGRVRGLLQFYGANRSGRWAGRLIQVQNLPRTYIEQLDVARTAVKKQQADTLKFCFGSVNDTLSQLIRTSFIAAPGNKLVDADFSSIEARIISWLAQENWRLEVFRTGGDIYCMSASSMFGVPVVKHGENAHLRQKGKIAELACIAEGQLVLTDKGLVPIEKVTLDMKLWDGEEWVTHEGVVYRGKKEVIEYDGLTATKNHLVWVTGESRPVRFELATSCGARLVQTGDSGQAIRLGKDYQPRKTLGREMESVLRSNPMYGVRQSAMAISRKFNKRSVKRLSKLFATKTNTEVARQTTNSSKATLRKSPRPRISELRSKRYQVQFPVNLGGWAVDSTKCVGCVSEKGIRPYRYESGLRTARMAVYESCCYTNVVSRDVPARNYRIGEKSCGRETEELARYQGKVRVYDIRNAGPRQRFTVSGKLVHNCGYGGSVGALIAMGALKIGIPEEDLPDIVARWREANQRIVELWYKVENAAISTIQTGKQESVNNLIFSREFDLANDLDFMTITLPSGRKLYYAHPELGVNQWDRPSINYLGVNQTTKQWTRLETYAGKLVENVVQAIARDCLAVAIERLEAAGFPVVFHVHDEVVIDCPESQANLDKVVELMTKPISWALGLPLDADGWVGDFFKKD